MLHRRSFIALAAALLLTVAPALAQNTDKGHQVDVVYGHKQGVALTMDVFLPAGKPSGIGVVWMVSGGWVSNHNSINPALAKPFTDRGHVVFQVVHGSQPKFTLPEIVGDIHRALRYIRTNASRWGVDPNRIGISGGSAGGHLSLMMAAYGGPGDPDAKDPVDRASSAVQAVACLFPPTDFLNWGKDGAAALDNPLLSVYRPVFGMAADAPREKQIELLKSLSPYYGITEKTVPIYIVHGDADKLVPLQQSEHLVSLLQQKGVPCKLDIKPGKGHGWPGMEQEVGQFIAWFEKYLPAK